VQELRAAQEAHFGQHQKSAAGLSRVNPHWSWKDGNQSKKLSEKQTSTHTIIEVCSPQVVLVEELNSRNWFMVNVKWIKPFNTATSTPNSGSNNGL